jgi:hypothetical protein
MCRQNPETVTLVCVRNDQSGRSDQPSISGIVAIGQVALGTASVLLLGR